MHIVVC